jgi:hypothetical protein
MAPNTHLLNQLGEHAVLLLRPLLALQGCVVLLELLQALEGAAAGLPKAEQKQMLLGLPCAGSNIQIPDLHPPGHRWT